MEKLVNYCYGCNNERDDDQSCNNNNYCPICGNYADRQEKKIINPIALLNTSIATADGTYTLETITIDQAKNLIQNRETISAVGHGPTARVMTDMLGIDVPENRIEFEQQPGQTALVFKLNRRLPEGKILSREEIEQIGYKFQILRREN